MSRSFDFKAGSTVLGGEVPLPGPGREDGVRALQQVNSVYASPGPFVAGDLVQSRDYFTGWSGHVPREMAPMLVLEVLDDLAEASQDEEQRGVMGLRLAFCFHDEEIGPGIAVRLDEAWHFEPYTGPMPDAH